MWSIDPAQNLPKNFLAPSALRSWITNGQRCRTLLRENRSLFSTTTTLAPSSWASIAVRKPHGPPPMISTYTRKKKNDISRRPRDSSPRIVMKDMSQQATTSWCKQGRRRRRPVTSYQTGLVAKNSSVDWFWQRLQTTHTYTCNSMCMCVCKNRKSRAGVTPFQSSEKPPNCWRHSGESRQKNQSGTERGCWPNNENRSLFFKIEGCMRSTRV